jgi:cell pole-organizing protein PopZ
MADLSGEPSMEDILASIKRVIKEGEAPAPRRAPPPPPARDDEPAARDAILELNEPLSMPTPAPVQQQPALDPWEERLAAAAAPLPSSTAPSNPAFSSPGAASPSVPQTPAPPAPPTPATPPQTATSAAEIEDAPVVSPATVEATRGALGALSRLIVKPEAESDGTLEGLVREMLRPMLSDWLDQNLPQLVEQMVAREIAKITSSQG